MKIERTSVEGQVYELLAKIIAYNLMVVTHEIYENGIEPEFLNGKVGEDVTLLN